MKDIATKSNNISSLSAEEFNNVQQEHENSITTSGQTLDEFNLFQQAEMVARYASTGATFYQDSGLADAYVLLPLGSFVAPAVYLDGALAVFKIGNDSTGASTVNYNGIGVKPLVLPDGSAISTEMIADEYATTRYNLADDRVELVSVSQSGAASSAGTLQSVQTFTASDTWTRPSGVNLIKITVVGGGGGGGFDIAGGGGAGGIALELIDVSSTPSAVVTIGTGGAGDTASGGSGATGGTSSFGAFASATGGLGGNSTGGSPARVPGGGGGGSGGDVNITGGAGGAPSQGDSMGGTGGSNAFGGGGRGREGNTAGDNGGNHGGGGGGGGGTSVGGDGAPGLIIVEEYG